MATGAGAVLRGGGPEGSREGSGAEGREGGSCGRRPRRRRLLRGGSSPSGTDDGVQAGARLLKSSRFTGSVRAPLL